MVPIKKVLIILEMWNIAEFVYIKGKFMVKIKIKYRLFRVVEHCWGSVFVKVLF